jgi:hypothetical protein
MTSLRFDFVNLSLRLPRFLGGESEDLRRTNLIGKLNVLCQ